jgi:hypothetical protein
MFPLDLSFLYVCKPVVETQRPPRARVVPGPCKPVNLACDREGNCKMFKIPELEKLDIYIEKKNED